MTLYLHMLAPQPRKFLEEKFASGREGKRRTRCQHEMCHTDANLALFLYTWQLEDSRYLIADSNNHHNMIIVTTVGLVSKINKSGMDNTFLEILFDRPMSQFFKSLEVSTFGMKGGQIRLISELFSSASKSLDPNPIECFSMRYGWSNQGITQL